MQTDLSVLRQQGQGYHGGSREEWFEWRVPPPHPAHCHPQQQQKQSGELPLDPRSWSRDDVAAWLQETASAHRLPPPPAERFLMNGKALCLMTIDMFLGRVPLGGKLLYKDFQLRLGKAMYQRAN